MTDEGEGRRDDTWARIGYAGMGVMLRIVLLFGSAAIAVALILTPILDRKTREASVYNIDRIATGSVNRGDGHIFTVRRSVLQPTPGSVCIIRGNGAKSGDC